MRGLLLFLALWSCTERVDPALLDRIDVERMRSDVDFLADDRLGGRIPGSVGHREAREHILSQMRAVGLAPFGTDGSFLHTYTTTAHPDRFQLEMDGTIRPNEVDTGYNLVGLLPGRDPELSKEHLVYAAHYDHLGVDDRGRVFNGAYDNATGVAVGLEIARALIEEPPKRSVIFIFTDDEENGLTGAKSWLAQAPIELDDILFGVSGDPLGRSLLPDYRCMILSGLERSPELLARWRETEEYAEIPLVFVHRAVIPIFASDQDEFHRAEMPLPAAWFLNPGFTFYHQHRDTKETVDYRALLADARYLTATFTLLGNEDRHFEYEGEPRIGAESARDLLVILDGILGSSVLSAEERTRVQEIRDDVALVERTDNIEALSDPEGFFVDAVYFTMFALSIEHPGPVPPPFPQ